MKSYTLRLYENGMLVAKSSHWRITIHFFKLFFWAFSILDKNKYRFLETPDSPTSPQ